MMAILLDSSFLVAFHNTRDTHHAAAFSVMPDLVAGRRGKILLLEYVFLEVATVLLARRGREVATQVTSTLLRAHEVKFVPCSSFFSATFETFRSQPGRNLSFTDAAIITLAQEYGQVFVATFDTDFQGIDGLTVVPEPPRE